MEIFTILKRDIIRKKGIFICVTLLSILVVSAFLSILAVKTESAKGLVSLQEETNCPDILSYVFDTNYNPELKGKIEAVDGVSKVIETEGLTSCNHNHRIKYQDGAEGKNLDSNTYLIEDLDKNIDNLKLYNSDYSEYEKEVRPLKKGEIYLPLGLKNKMKCNVGDYYVDEYGVSVELVDGEPEYSTYRREYKIAGFVASPLLGSNVIGWKEVFISHEDYLELRELSIEGTEVMHEYHTCNPEDYSLVNVIYKIYSDGSLTDAKLLRKINIETGMSNFAEGTITKTESADYTNMYLTIVGGVLVVFAFALLIVDLIIIASSISGEMETDYKKLGILKALGFSNFKIGTIIALLYLTAEFIGFVIGIILSLFLKVIIGNIFVPITAALPYQYISVSNVLIIFGAMALSSILVITLKLIRLRRVSPIRAINGNTNDIYFSPRINTPISKKFLSLSISVKQVLSAPIRYLSIVLITALLSFFMLTSVRMSNLTRSENIAKLFGMANPNIAVMTYTKEPVTYEMFNEIKEATLKHSKIDYMFSSLSSYVSMNGENILCEYCLNSEDSLGIYQGRAPIYDNEFVTTKNICEKYDLKIGDKVTLESRTGKAEFILVGIHQKLHDTGKNITISYEGALKIDNTIKLHYINIEIEDYDKVQDVLTELKSISNDRFNVIDRRNVENQEMLQYKETCDIITIVIFTFAAIFALITVRLKTVKAFNQERLDLGIYKANGFSVFKLRNTMALRFMIASLLGIILGIILSIFLSNPTLGLMLHDLGMSRVRIDNTLLDYTLVILIGLVVTYLGSFIASRRIKRVSTRELVSE